MFNLTFPPHDFKIKEEENGRYIFDFIRKKYVMLTPEEWVRQHVLAYLCEVMNYPKGLISVEREIKINNLKKRYDIAVYDYNHKPWMLVECKESNVAIDDKTLQQVLRYNQSLQCPYWFLSNGHQNFCAEIKAQEVKWLNALPAYNN